MTGSGIEPATFRFVAQHLNHCAIAVPEDRISNKNFIVHLEDVSLCAILVVFMC